MSGLGGRIEGSVYTGRGPASRPVCVIESRTTTQERNDVKTASPSTLWDRIEEARGRYDVLQHSFYQRWSAGELTMDELAHYSGQYRHAVQAIATMSANAAREGDGAGNGLNAHAAEEAGHVALWDGFVDAVGGNPADEAHAETAECVDSWTADEGLLPTLVRLYAVESGQPEISRTKLNGLRDHYGIDGGPGTEYFSVHETLDLEHSRHARDLIEKLVDEDTDTDALVGAAESVFRGNWRLLDGVEAAR
jgi:pyrroloquinoline-quinone synthase